MQVTTTSPGITAAAAVAAVAGSGKSCRRPKGWKINVAVADRSGNLMAFLRMPGAFLHSIDIAIDKAYTAASFGFPTKDWMSSDEGMKLGFSAQPRLIVFGGGVPICPEGETEWIGGIGVSGASEAQDEECARAGLEAIGIK
jgi:uncharacterized protein GlcG (DUF336 family)